MRNTDLIPEIHEKVIRVEEHLKAMNGKQMEHTKQLEAQAKELEDQKLKLNKINTWYIVRGWAIAVLAFVIGLFAPSIIHNM